MAQRAVSSPVPRLIGLVILWRVAGRKTTVGCSGWRSPVGHVGSTDLAKRRGTARHAPEPVSTHRESVVAWPWALRCRSDRCRSPWIAQRRG
jgi:hypothetical protein